MSDGLVASNLMKTKIPYRSSLGDHKFPDTQKDFY